AQGCAVFTAATLDDVRAAYAKARAAATDRPAVVVVRTAPSSWTEAGAWWEVGVPEVSDRDEVLAARTRLAGGKARQVRYLSN
ncbi:MAG: 3D-(3,5/4)-trihydroxycyclohexane-1,2-dione acylhydrolase (decyclizing), partial [Actinomycetota bacterium]|nr:3D-(3,5/4)-trihydroxycyclohexane-1,2-dione acylhydrolase (decyclizing) [Actinomycetota bacterium]